MNINIKNDIRIPVSVGEVAHAGIKQTNTKIDNKVPVSVGQNSHANIKLNGTIVELDKSHEKYQGDYVVESDVKDQVIETKDKVMTDNVTILKIPAWEVSNETGGKTFYIGKEV